MKVTKWNTSIGFGVKINYPTTDVIEVDDGVGHIRNFMEVLNHNTGHLKVTDELSDDLFNQGYRFYRYCDNKTIDILELDAVAEESRLKRMAESASDPCYWSQVQVESGKCASDNASDPIYHAPLEIY